MKFGEKVRFLLKQRDISLTKFAGQLGVAQPQLSRWLEAEALPRVEYLRQFARLLGVTVDFLVFDEIEEIPDQAHGEWERRVWEIVREIGAEAAWRRLVRSGGDAKAIDTPSAVEEHGHSEWGPLRDETEAELRRERDRSRAKPAPKKGAAAEDAKKR